MPSPSPSDVRSAIAVLRSPVLREALTGHEDLLAPLLLDATYAPDQLVCGDVVPTPGLFICVDGQLAVWTRDSYVQDFPRTVERGSVFGRFEAPAPLKLGEGVAPLSPLGERSAQDHLLARAMVPSRVWTLPWDALPRLIAALPDAAELLRFMPAFARWRPRLVAALIRALAFGGVNLRRLDQLVEGAHRLSAAPGEALVHPGDRFPGVMMVVAGRVIMEVAPDDLPDDTADMPPLTLEPGAVYGDVLTATGSAARYTVRAGPEGATLAVVQPDQLRTLFDASPAFRRVRLAEGMQRTFAMVYSRLAEGELLLVETAADRATSTALAAALCAELADAYADPVLRVTWSDGADPRFVREGRSGGWLTLPASRLPGDFDRATLRRVLHDALTPFGTAIDAWFQVYLEPGPPGLAARLGPVVTRRVVVAPPEVLPALSGGTTADAPSFTLRAALVDPHVAPTGPLPAGCIRVELDLPAIRAAGGRLAGLPVGTRDSLARLGRAATERLVGLALGGGGALGYAHLALLRSLHTRGIPVDVVAGSSFGTVAGAYWCALGPEGIDRLLADGRTLNVVIGAASVSARVFQEYIDRRLGGRRLEQLTTPLLPVSTDLGTGAPYVLRDGTVGRGARFSGAFPPLLASVDWHGMRLVDGGFCENVPTAIAAWEGANLLVASNIISAPPLGPDSGRADWRRTLASLNPVRRLLDAGRASLTLMHKAGEGRYDFSTLKFEPAFSTAEFWDMSKGPDVVRAAEATADATAETVQRVWDALRAPGSPFGEPPRPDPGNTGDTP